MAGDQYAVAVREKVGDQVGDGVRLTGARRPLDHDEIAVPQPLGDGALFVVGGQREVQLPWRSRGVTAVRFSQWPVTARTGDRPQQNGGLGALLDGQGDGAQRFEHAAPGALSEQQHRREADDRYGGISRCPVPMRCAVVASCFVGRDDPGGESPVQVVGQLRIRGVADGFQLLPYAGAGVRPRLLPRVEHGLLQRRAAVLGIGSDGDGPGVGVDGDDGPAGDEMAADRLALRRPGEVAEADDQFEGLAEFGGVHAQAVEAVVGAYDELRGAVETCPPFPFTGPGAVLGVHGVTLGRVGQGHGDVPGACASLGGDLFRRYVRLGPRLGGVSRAESWISRSASQ